MFIIGLFILGSALIENMVGSVENRVTIQAFLSDDADQAAVTALSLIGLLDDNAHVTGSIKLGNEELIGKTDEEMSELRGTKISMIFQDPLSALTPMFSIGDQLAEALLTQLSTLLVKV